MTRTAETIRKTKETNISIVLNIDGTGLNKINTPIHFLNHMLESFSKHGKFDLEIKAKGDIDVDRHHTIEDIGIVLGETFKEALGDKMSIRRISDVIVPMDEALASAILDISGRAYMVLDTNFTKNLVGDFETEHFNDFFQAFTTSMGLTLHLTIIKGRSDHHKIEAAFKAVARALRIACEIDPREMGVPSTKGALA